MSRNIIERILSKPIQHLLVTNKPLPNIEVLRLYRDVLKATTGFFWFNQKGQCWRDVLRKSARKQFDNSKYETDPVLLMKMMLTTRQAIAKVQLQIFQTQQRLNQTVSQTRNQGKPKNEYSR